MCDVLPLGGRNCKRRSRRPKKHFRYDAVYINATGMPEYNPALPNVYKWDTSKQKVAGDVVAYVDDLRTIGHFWEAAWGIARKIASRLQMLGIQDATYKRRLADVPWAGGIYGTDKGQITKTVTGAKWTKGKAMLKELLSVKCSIPSPKLSYKRLEQI